MHHTVHWHSHTTLLQLYMFNCIKHDSLSYSSSSSDDMDGLFRGIAHTESCLSYGTNSQILSCKYHCLVNDKPSGVRDEGKFNGKGFRLLM